MQEKGSPRCDCKIYKLPLPYLMSIFGLFKRNTNIIKKIDKSNSYSFDYQKNSYIFMLIGEVEREGISGGLCTPAQG
jgi:hypothetical protein